MPRFEPYDPHERGEALRDVRVRAATAADAPAIAALIAERDERDEPEALAQVQGEIARIEGGARKHLCAAERAGAVVGFGRATFLPISEIEGAWGMPDGWYLTGVIVAPALRRGGIGRALTEHRLGWLRERAERAYYYTSSRNLASIALHQALGFREISRDIGFPGMTFSLGGVGVCYALDLRVTAG